MRLGSLVKKKCVHEDFLLFVSGTKRKRQLFSGSVEGGVNGSNSGHAVAEPRRDMKVWGLVCLL